MKQIDERHYLGCKAMGMLTGIVKAGLLDHSPSIKQLAVDLDREWEATFPPKTTDQPKEAA